MAHARKRTNSVTSSAGTLCLKLLVVLGLAALGFAALVCADRVPRGSGQAQGGWVVLFGLGCVALLLGAAVLGTGSRGAPRVSVSLDDKQNAGG